MPRSLSKTVNARRRKFPNKSNNRHTKRPAIAIDSEDKETATDGSISGSNSKKSDLVVALLEHKAKAGIKAMHTNNGRMPRGWYPAAIKSLNAQPGCAEIKFQRCDIENKIRKIMNDQAKQIADQDKAIESAVAAATFNAPSTVNPTITPIPNQMTYSVSDALSSSMS